jgi:hypothetical protein
MHRFFWIIILDTRSSGGDQRLVEALGAACVAPALRFCFSQVMDVFRTIVSNQALPF